MLRYICKLLLKEYIFDVLWSIKSLVVKGTFLKQICNISTLTLLFYLKDQYGTTAVLFYLRNQYSTTT